MYKNIALISLLFGLTTGPAWPGPALAADPSAGQKIAETWCVSCHTVSGRTAGRDTAPPFDLTATACCRFYRILTPRCRKFTSRGNSLMT